MVAIAFTPELVEKGKNLLEELDASNVKVDSALWFYFSEQGFWKLMLSIPDVKKEGPKAGYEKIQKALSKLGAGQAPALDDVVVAKPDAPLLRLLKIAVRTGPGISGIRFTNNVINGQLIPDAYIYRLT